MSSTQRQYELIFSLQASLGSNFVSTMTASQKAINNLQSSVKDLNSITNDITAYNKRNEALTTNQTKLESLQLEHQRLQESMEGVETPSQSMLTAMARNEAQIDRLTATIQSQESSLNTLGNRLTEAGVDTNNLTAEQQRLNAEMEESIRIQNQLSNINTAQQTNNANIDQTKSQLGTAIGVTAAATASVYAFAVAPTIEYESQMAVVESITRATEEEMALLDATAKEMGQTTSFSATQSAQAMEYLGMAGWDTTQTIAGLPSVLALAAASGGEMGATADIISNGVSAFGLEVDQSGQYADLLAQTSRSANTDVAKMGETFEKVGSLAGTMGYSVEDLAFGSAVMASTGLAGAEAGTQLKTSIANMVAPTKAMSEAMSMYGISLTDSEGEMLPFKDLLDSMRVSFGDLDEVERASVATTLFGKEAMAGMLSIINASDEEYTRLTNEVYNYTGAAQEMADIRLDTLEGDMDLLASATESLQLALGEAILPTVRAITQAVTEVIVKIAKWVEENQALAVVVLKIGAGLSALVIGILAVKLVALQLYGAYLAVKKAMLLAQVGQSNFIATLVKLAPMIAVITAIGGAIYLICNHLEEVRNWIGKTFGSDTLAYFDGFIATMQAIGDIISSVFSGDIENAKNLMAETFGEGGLILFESLQNAFTSIKSSAIALFNSLKAIASAFLPLLAQIISAVVPIIADIISVVVPIIATLGVAFLDIASFVLPFFLDALSFVAYVLADVIEWVSMVVTAFTTFREENEALVSGITKIIAIIGSAILIFQTVLAIASAVATGIGTVCGVISGGITAVVTAFSAVNPIFLWISAIVAVGSALYWICTHMEEVRNWIEKTFGGDVLAYFDNFVDMVRYTGGCVAEGFTAIMQILATTGEAIALFVGNAISFLQPLIDFVLTVFVAQWQTAWSMVQTIISLVVDNIKVYIDTAIAIFNGLIQFITGVFTGNWSTAWNGIKSIFSGVFEGIKSICSNTMNAIVSAINTVIGGLNKLSIPDWVPGVGGMTLNIPLIPQFAKGTENTPDTFIAGEQGAELITGSAGKKVFTALQTGEIINNIEKARTLLQETTEVTQIAMVMPLNTVQNAVSENRTSTTQNSENTTKDLQIIISLAPVLQQALGINELNSQTQAQMQAQMQAQTQAQTQMQAQMQAQTQTQTQAQTQAQNQTTTNFPTEKLEELQNTVYLTSMLPLLATAITTNTEIHAHEGMEQAQGVQNTSFVGDSQRNIEITINSAPTINVNGGSAENIESTLAQSNADLKSEIIGILAEITEDRGRRSYD